MSRTMEKQKDKMNISMLYLTSVALYFSYTYDDIHVSMRREWDKKANFISKALFHTIVCVYVCMYIQK